MIFRYISLSSQRVKGIRILHSVSTRELTDSEYKSLHYWKRLYDTTSNHTIEILVLFSTQIRKTSTELSLFSTQIQYQVAKWKSHSQFCLPNVDSMGYYILDPSVKKMGLKLKIVISLHVLPAVVYDDSNWTCIEEHPSPRGYSYNWKCFDRSTLSMEPNVLIIHDWISFVRDSRSWEHRKRFSARQTWMFTLDQIDTSSLDMRWTAYS